MKKSGILLDFLSRNLFWVLLVIAINGISGWVRATGASYLGKITDITESGSLDGLWLLVLIGAVIMASSYFFRWLGAVLCEYLTEKLALETRIRMVEHLKHISFLRYEGFSIGDLQSAFRNDIGSAAKLIYILLSRILNNVFLFLFSVIVMLRINVPMTALIVAIVLITAVVNNRILQKQKKYQYESKQSLGRMTAQIEKNHGAIDTIKSYWVPDFITDKLQRERTTYNEATQKSEQVDAGRLTIYNLVNNSILFGSLLFLGYQGIQGKASVSDIIVYIYLVKQVMVPVEVIFRWMSTMVGSLAAWDRVCDLLNHPEEQSKREQDGIVACASAENISFSYDEADLVLDNLSIALAKGTLTGLSGSSGSGKTTLIKILLGLYHSLTAEFRIDSKKRDSFFGLSVYASVAEPLFPLSIYENISLGNCDISREDCSAMLEHLGFGTWISSLSEEIDTVLGEKALSGGQLQSIANARALLSSAPIIILDEPFSALDKENEELLKKELERQKEHKLILFTSHRTETMNICDKVYVLR